MGELLPTSVKALPRLPFLTGSRAYGVPHNTSDVDIVMFCPGPLDLSHIEYVYGQPKQTGTHQWTVRAGELNLIICTNEATYDTWKNGTAYLKSFGTVTREVACAYFNNVGVTGGSRPK